MDDEQFRQRLSAWSAVPEALARGGYLGYPHPLDATIDALCALYLVAARGQRERLVAVVLPPHVEGDSAMMIAANVLSYVRRCGRRMRDAGDIELLRLGVTAAALAGEMVDAAAEAMVDRRDLAVAVVFLRAGAGRAGISAERALHLLDEVWPETSPETCWPASNRVGPLGTREVIGGVFRSDETTIARIVAYHVGTG